MSDLYNFPLNSSDTEEKEKENEIIPENDSKNLHRIHHLVHRNKEARSQSAPLEEANNDDDTEFLSSYNYYIYYHSKAPRDPHLPKPKYVPKPDLGDIKESKAKDEEDQPKSNNDKQLENINQMMNNLNLDKPIVDINKLLNDEFQFDNINNNSSNKPNNNENNTNIGQNYNNINNDKGNNFLPNKLDLIGDDNINLYNFVNNNANSANLTSEKNINNDNYINSMGINQPFNSNVNNGNNEQNLEEQLLNFSGIEEMNNSYSDISNNSFIGQTISNFQESANCSFTDYHTNHNLLNISNYSSNNLSNNQIKNNFGMNYLNNSFSGVGYYSIINWNCKY